MGFENLPDVHTGGNAQRVQYDFDRRSVRQIRHIFFRQNARDHALVSVAASHLVAHRKLALHGDVDLDQLNHARRQFVALAQLGDFFVGDFFEHGDLARGHFFDLVDLLVDARVLVGNRTRFRSRELRLFDRVAIENGALGKQLLVGLFVVQVGQHFLAFQQCRGAWRARRSGCGFRPPDCAADALSAILRCAGERSSLSWPLREKILQSTTVPSMPGGK